MVLQQKTGRPVQFEITEQTRQAVADWIAYAQLKSNDYLFPSRMLARVCPILQPSIVDAGEGLIEVVFAYQEGIMLGGNLAIVLVEVE